MTAIKALTVIFLYLSQQLFHDKLLGWMHDTFSSADVPGARDKSPEESNRDVS